MNKQWLTIGLLMTALSLTACGGGTPDKEIDSGGTAGKNFRFIKKANSI